MSNRAWLVLSATVVVLILVGTAWTWYQDYKAIEERYERVERRIDSFLPKERGVQAIQQFREELPWIKVTLIRRNADDPENAYTMIRVGNHHEFKLPPGAFDEADVEGTKRRLEQYDEVFARVRDAIAATWARMGNNPEAKGDIRIPRPKGLKVPHGDVVRVLDTFIQVGLTDVKFEGAPAPMPTAGGGGSVTGETDER